MSLKVTQQEWLSSLTWSQRRGGVLRFLWTLKKDDIKWAKLKPLHGVCLRAGLQTRQTFNEVKLSIAEGFPRTHSDADHTFSIVHFHNHLVEQCWQVQTVAVQSGTVRQFKNVQTFTSVSLRNTTKLVLSFREWKRRPVRCWGRSSKAKSNWEPAEKLVSREKCDLR